MYKILLELGLTIIITYLITYEILYVITYILVPELKNYSMKEVDRNPKWIISRLPYYGLKDIDIVVCECDWDILPRVRIRKKDCIELWIDQDTKIEDVENIGRLALLVKLKIKYNLWFPEKPIYWLSILCYMLDGGNVEVSNTPSITTKEETS